MPGRQEAFPQDPERAIAFDTLQYARKLKKAGVPDNQAEAQAEIMGEAFSLNMDALATKDHPDAKFEEQDARIEARMDIRFAETDRKFRLLTWMPAMVTAATVIPAVPRLLA